MAPKKNIQRRTYRFSRLTSAAHSTIDWIGSLQSVVVHTIVFAVSFGLVLFGFDFDRILLIVTTLVSLEAIYLAIFIQMSVNQNTQSLSAVEEDIDEIQEDVDEIQEDVEEIQKDVDEIEKDVGDIEKDIDEIQKDVDEIEKDDQQEANEKKQSLMLEKMDSRVAELSAHIEKLKASLKR